jgi:hypothetical protein
MQNKTIVIVTKDRAEFNIFHPVAELLKKRGYTVTLIAEGLSMDMWVKAGWDILQGKPTEGLFDANTLCRFDMDPEKILKEIHPALVLSGLGCPIRLGEMFGLAANQLGIRLAFVEDVWGAHSRSKALPRLICTPDTFGAKRVTGYAPYDGQKVVIAVTGSPAIENLVKPKANQLVTVRLQRYARRILVLGQDEATTGMVEGLVEAVGKEKGTILIPRWHPKWTNITLDTIAQATTDQEKFQKMYDDCQRWKKAVEPFSIEFGPEVSTPELMAGADEVVSVYSNGLIEAAWFEKLAVSWNSPIGRIQMAKSLGGIDQFPLVSQGIVTEVNSLEEFKKLPPVFSGLHDEAVKRSRALLEGIHKGATERVVAHLEELMRLEE